MKQVVGILMLASGVGLALLSLLNLVLMIPGIIKAFSGNPGNDQAFAVGYVVGALVAAFVFILISSALIFFGRRLAKSPQPPPQRPY